LASLGFAAIRLILLDMRGYQETRNRMVREIWHVGSNPTLSAKNGHETRMDTSYAGFVFGARLPLELRNLLA
jgi:hypothetical protein